MKTSNIHSSQLPLLPESIKECINMGHWLLFKDDTCDDNFCNGFYIKSNDCVFLLSPSGEILSKVTPYDKGIGEIYYFTDVARPTSLSGLNC